MNLISRIAKLIFIFVLVFLYSFCGTKQPELEKIIEDGVEVIINHLEPYKIEGEPGNLYLEKNFMIDLERDDLAELGITEITGFDVDSKGNIYLGSYRSTDNFIFKFDENGRYIDSFCRKGQGPGELQGLINLRINNKDEIILTNGARDRVIVLNTFGGLIKEVPIASNHVLATLLENEKILAMESIRKPGEGIFFPIAIYESDIDDFKILRQGQRLQNFIAAKKLNGLKLTLDYSQWSISKELIFVDNQENGYEFLVYNSEGILIRKIRKEYKPVKVPQDVKEKVYARFEGPDYEQENIHDKIFFPDYMPPFQYFFVDDIGRLYVMTFEKGEGERYFIFDIFNPDGFFIGRTALDNSGNILGSPPFQVLLIPWGGPYDVKVKNNKLYCMRNKDSGYQELVVYKMIWE